MSTLVTSQQVRKAAIVRNWVNVFGGEWLNGKGNPHLTAAAWSSCFLWLTCNFVTFSANLSNCLACAGLTWEHMSWASAEMVCCGCVNDSTVTSMVLGRLLGSRMSCLCLFVFESLALLTWVLVLTSAAWVQGPWLLLFPPNREAFLSNLVPQHSCLLAWDLRMLPRLAAFFAREDQWTLLPAGVCLEPAFLEIVPWTPSLPWNPHPTVWYEDGAENEHTSHSPQLTESKWHTRVLPLG